MTMQSTLKERKGEWQCFYIQHFDYGIEQNVRPSFMTIKYFEEKK